MDSPKKEGREDPNHEAIPPEQVPAASPKLDALPRAPKHLAWGWLVLLIAIGVIALLSRWR